MKKILALACALLLLPTTMAAAYNGNVEVHITNTGACYHKAGCGALRSDIPVTLRYAVENGYLPCDRCHPPHPDFEYTATEKREKSSSSGSGSNTDQNKTADLKQQELDRIKELAQKDAERRESERRKASVFFRNAILLFIGIPACFFYFYDSAQKSRKRKEEYALSEVKKRGFEQAMEKEIVEYSLETAKREEKFRADTITLTSPPLKQPLQKEETAPLVKESSLKKPPLKQDEFPLHPDFAIPYQERYRGKSISKEAGVPEGFWFDDDDLPHGKSLLGVDPFQVFGSPKGKIFHAPNCTRMRNAREMNLCTAIAEGRTPCRYCRPMAEIPPWVSQYQKISKLRRQCSIEMFP